MMPACAGPTVAPTVTALIMIAAEMAMMVRLTEDPDISSSFCFVVRAARLLVKSIHEACQAR